MNRKTALVLSLLTNIVFFLLGKKKHRGHREGHKKQLTHLVVLFDHRYPEQLRHSLSFWKEHTPSTEKTDIALLLCSTARKRDASKLDELEYTVKALIGRNLDECFASIQIVHAAVPASVMEQGEQRKYILERIFEGKIEIKNAGYVLITDPFVVPAQPDWLARLAERVRYPASEFWILGSINKGNQEIDGKEEVKPAYKAKFLRILSPAVYNLADRKFVGLCLSVLRNMPERRTFDTELYRKIYEPSNFDHSRAYIHKYVYTDMIRAYWKSHLRIPSDRNVLLVHNIKGGDIEDSTT
ncbi:MAG: uncharacterized protein A8A55_0464 [Amphiamblys sp. WSBS2006]|nr:MAG: uncharacterized protein A8A55_0464 [Amphiamblys sp. WSBS2006]